LFSLCVLRASFVFFVLLFLWNTRYTKNHEGYEEDKDLAVKRRCSKSR
jgi:hypothetical protein